LDEQDKPLDPEFMGHGRASTDIKGDYWFETIKPGTVPGPENKTQAPHINVIVFARGMLSHAFTRIYFEDEADNRNDPVLMSIEDEAYKNTLIAKREETAGVIVYRFDIRFQGENETAFFDA
jgi:protocatechuate 3,4-dioxygenase alpha subunit